MLGFSENGLGNAELLALISVWKNGFAFGQSSSPIRNRLAVSNSRKSKTKHTSGTESR